MRFARATLMAAMATSSLIAAASKSINHQKDDELQQELLYLTSIMKEISNEQSWSSDILPLSDDDHGSFSSLDEEEVTQWMERKENEVQNYYTLLSEDGERRGRRSSMAAAQKNDGGSEDPIGSHHQGHLVKMDELTSERRQLRIVPTEKQSPPNTEDAHRELGKGVGMKRSDPRAAGRFTPTEERTPPKGRDREPPSDKVSAAAASSGGTLERGPQEGVVTTESSEDKSPPRTQVSSRTQGGTGSRWSHVRKSAKSMKQPPPPPPPPKQQFPNAVYVQQPPPPPPQHHQQQVVIKQEVEECYDIEELTAMGLMLNIQSTQDVVMVQQQQQQQQNQVLIEEQQQEEMMTATNTRSVPPIYRYDGTLVNQKPGSRRSLQKHHHQQQRDMQYYPYNYWTWDAKTVKSAKNAKLGTVYVTQPQPQPQVVHVGQQQPAQPLPPPPPSTTTTLVYLNSKSAKSKSSKMGKMTKSGKVCLELPPPTPPTPSLPSICGTTLATASTNCNQPCTTDADCPEIMDVCIPNVEACANDNGGGNTEGYCGITEEDASSKCAVPCVSDVGCPSGEKCFTTDGVIVGCSFGYCGTSPLDAGKCAEECSSDEECPDGEGCYSQGSIGECSSLGYCGTSPLDASKCAVECTSSGDCPGGESCWSQGSIGGCATIKPGHCGADLDDASKCATECTSDGDCPGGESCFIGSVECKPGFCGADGDDATKCEVPCSSDLGCPSGETCFTGVKCVAQTRCPTGCKDCDPDSPLPCPNPMMKQVCDKQNDTLYPPGDPKAGERISNFRDCYDMCKPSFCCIHASLSKEIAPTCAKEYENCPLYYPCYIIWWKLHDTIGPAPYLRVEQKEPFFNVKLDQLESDFQKDPTFFNQLFGHHFDTDDPMTDDKFEDPDNW